MIADILKTAESKMQGTIEHVKEELGGIRTGRAHPAMFNKSMVDYYGTPTPLQQLATFQVPEARTVLISPFDRGSMNAIEKAIRDSDLGVNPSNDGNMIRCILPALTEDRRKEYIKMAKSKAEDARVAVRNIRRNCIDQLKKLQKDGDISEDDHRKQSDRVQKMTDDTISTVDSLLAGKEAEILHV